MSTRAFVSSFVVLLALLFAPAARAENPNVVFKGKILVSDKRFPQSAKSPTEYVKKMRAQAKASFNEDKEKQAWKLYFVGFLNAKLNDLEYLVKVYDITPGGQKRLIQSFEQYTTDRGQETITTNFTLEKKSTGANRTLQVTMESKNKVLASGTFKVMGEGEKYTGKVDFSKDDDEKKEE